MSDTAEVLFDGDRNRGAFAARRKAWIVAPTATVPQLVGRPNYRLKTAHGIGYLILFDGARRWIPIVNHPDYIDTATLVGLHQSVTEAGL